MIEVLLVIVAALLIIAAATIVGPRLGVASPLLLVAVGVAASFLPLFTSVHLEPDWILAGILPPLLYSSAVSMPAMNFRREFAAISGLSVLLVIVSALVLGVFFALLIPSLGFAWGVALGAIISPTDAVATSMIRKTAVSRRVVAILDGESLLNDATALVLLRSAIVATAAAFSFWGAVGTFVYAVLVAVVIGGVVGSLDLAVRKRVSDPAVNTVISFTVPFIASIPATQVGASGLVAAVVAGLVTGVRAPRDLSPQSRLSDAQNWRMVELVLEGAIFLTMGLQIRSILVDVEQDGSGWSGAVLIATGALALTILVRAAYVAPLLVVLQRWTRHNSEIQSKLEDLQQTMGTPQGKRRAFDEMNARARGRPSERDLDRFVVRVTRGLADIDYFARAPLGWRDGTIVVWAGMRGAVTVAAAQTLPPETPQRSELVLIAFAVAALSLVFQGGTMRFVLRRLASTADQAAMSEQRNAQRTRIFELLKTSAETVPVPPDLDTNPSSETFEIAKRYRLAVIAAQRRALLDARDNGTFDADVLTEALENLDASQINIEMRARLVG